MIIQADFTGADKKTAILIRIPSASKLWLTILGTKIVKQMMVNVSCGVLHSRTSQFMKNIGMEVNTAGEAKYNLAVGTGIGGRKSVVYASVHEFGAMIRAKKAKFLRFKTADGKLHFVKKVTIPARHPLAKAVEKVLKKQNVTDMSGEILRVAEGMSGKT